MGWVRKRYGTLVSYDFDPFTLYRAPGEDGRWRWAVYNGSNLPIEHGETGNAASCRREVVASVHRIRREATR